MQPTYNIGTRATPLSNLDKRDPFTRLSGLIKSDTSSAKIGLNTLSNTCLTRKNLYPSSIYLNTSRAVLRVIYTHVYTLFAREDRKKRGDASEKETYWIERDRERLENE